MFQSKLQKISSYLLLTVSDEQKLLCLKTEGKLFQAMTEGSELVNPNCAVRENNPHTLFSITYFKTCKTERNNATHFLQSFWFHTFFYVWMSNSSFNYFLHYFLHLQDCSTYLCWLQEHKKLEILHPHSPVQWYCIQLPLWRLYHLPALGQLQMMLQKTSKVSWKSAIQETMLEMH